MANTGEKLFLLGKSRPSGRVLRTDPYALVDGHYVGHDGFVVPRNADEFLERFPNYVSRWVKKRLNGSAVAEDVEDWAQDLILHLKYLPETSKHRLEGKSDVIETFDPAKHHGANEARFRNYVNLCLANRFNTLFAKRRRDALGRNNWVPLAGGFGCKEPGTVDDEFCHRESAYLEAAAQRLAEQEADRLRIVELIRFAERCDPGVLPAIHALMQAANCRDAARHLGVSPAEFRQIGNRMKRMGRLFLLVKTVGSNLQV